MRVGISWNETAGNGKQYWLDLDAVPRIGELFTYRDDVASRTGIVNMVHWFSPDAAWDQFQHLRKSMALIELRELDRG